LGDGSDEAGFIPGSDSIVWVPGLNGAVGLYDQLPYWSALTVA